MVLFLLIVVLVLLGAGTLLKALGALIGLLFLGILIVAALAYWSFDSD